MPGQRVGLEVLVSTVVLTVVHCREPKKGAKLYYEVDPLCPSGYNFIYGSYIMYFGVQLWFYFKQC